jgi:peptidyl-prolyl cis-trans isomerase A (cyclophilin A)
VTHSPVMPIRFAPLATILFALTAAAPAKRTRPIPAPVVLPDTVRVVLTTELGPITLDLDNKHAPITTQNFVRYVDQKRLDGTVFYRVMRLDWGTPPNGIIQGGPRGDPKRVLKPIAHEPTTTTGILHTAGTVSMARLAPGTATGDFTILLSDQPFFDAKPTEPDPNTAAGYAAFGHVVTGMDVVKKIYDLPLSTTLGEGFLKGQMIEKPVKIITARRVAREDIIPAR